MANLNTKVGVILARLQPIHNGHLALIEKACKENEVVWRVSPRQKSVS